MKKHRKDVVDIVDIHEELDSYKEEFGLIQKIACSDEENKEYMNRIKAGHPLPKGVYRYVDDSGNETSVFYTKYTPELTDQEMLEYISLKKLHVLNIIKNCVIFFVILTVLVLVAAVLPKLAEVISSLV